MWNLISIEATNLCAFEHFKYSLIQNHATLIFGDNLDNDSQNSNGSGKSAMIEAIAIALTGETLRKVTMDEIINDRFDECVIEAALANVGYDAKMTIIRRIPRKGTQEIKILFDTEGEQEEIKQATVADYNKYILDTLGLSKDDVYSNFILTTKKYKSFLSSSDREKKEIINRFSNGVLVDESIEALHQDMEPVKEELLTAEKLVAENTGKVNAIEGEIANALADVYNRAFNLQQRIENWNQAISDKRHYIREQEAAIREDGNAIKKLDELDGTLQKLEQEDKGFKDKYVIISEHLTLNTDYAKKVDDLQLQAQQYDKETKRLQYAEGEAKRAYNLAVDVLEKAKLTYNKQVAEVKTRESDIKDRLAALADNVRAIQKKEDDLRQQRRDIQAKISRIATLLSGVIVCPKCKHEFVLDPDVDVAAQRKEQASYQASEQQVLQQIESAQEEYDACVADGKKARTEEAEISTLRLAIEQDLRNAESAVLKTQQTHLDMEENARIAASNVQRVLRQIETLHKDMFDDAFDALDKEIYTNQTQIRQYKLNITNAEGAIQSYKESIKAAENAAETDIVANLKKSKAQYEKDLQQSISDKEAIERQYNEFQVQEANFTEFKTYLANIKIDAISEITNNFLETIGSDIRVKLSGYTLLKSGKVRDKISVSLIRDGIDCGSFEKFSKGEQTRVELANILALHKLTNVNCEEGKGLNLLVFDEILDATDEEGLANVFKALNDTQITSLVVSHGQLAENYPNRLVIHKQNGISFID